jgi:two-component system sensor histidine kinase KdpD
MERSLFTRAQRDGENSSHDRRDASDEAVDVTTPQGRLRTYLGTAPGVGKTYAMLNEGRRRVGDGERVVVGWIEAHDRAATQAQVGSLEVAASRTVEYGGRAFEEMDVDAILALKPDVVLVDELAHVSPDGKRRRWEDVADLLAAGVDVVTTVNVANLESVRDIAAQLAGAGMREPVPDALVRGGDVVLVDLPPEALRRRIATGQVYSTDQVGGALSAYFEVSNLTALTELARAWVDDTLDTVGLEILRRRGQATRRSVIAGVSGADGGDEVIRRAASVAAEADADLIVVHVDVRDGLDHRRADALARHRALTAELCGVYIEVRGDSVPEALAAAAREHDASQVVVGRYRTSLQRLVRGSVASRLQRLLPRVEVDEVRPAP